MICEVTFNNFVGVFENAYSDEYCDRIVTYYNNMTAAGFGEDRMKQDSALNIKKDDVAVFANGERQIMEVPLLGFTKEFNEKFWAEFYPAYAQKYAILTEYDNHSVYSYKIQKTSIGGGYHIWHSEDSARSVCGRVLVWMLYLNDVDEGGETEFLYYPMRVKAKKGRLIIWPAGFTHTHRGNPPISNEKYVVTGWVEF